jgi:hypothetical protein
MLSVRGFMVHKYYEVAEICLNSSLAMCVIYGWLSTYINDHQVSLNR